MPLQPWKKLSSRDIVRDRWVRLRADRVELAPGCIADPYYILEEPAWVHVLALDANQRLLLVRQYRYGAGAFLWELPGGNADAGEDPFVTARRELREETGAVAPTWRHLGRWFANPARQNNRFEAFLATDTRIVAAPAPDATEALKTRWFTLAETDALVASGEFGNVMHVGAYYRARHLFATPDTLPPPLPVPPDKPLA